MSWYDVFSKFYDGSLERLYLPFRQAAAERLALAPGQYVLDAGCGTGQSLDVLSPPVGSTGKVIGVDLSKGMLDAAKRRVASKGFGNVELAQGSVLELDRAMLAPHLLPTDHRRPRRRCRLAAPPTRHPRALRRSTGARARSSDR
ncbi:MAG: methyltransferase domain-containing protein [Polyangiaceae bacterium]|nr:methyltransferase domain-containing protein [Polyangiaceae bacterium]